ncbi:MAG: hypothetical protein F6K53_33315 [Moorea sp. SIO4A1]|uniref:hypothetical protein n=1 Tax=Moorena sp. SIO4A1 TaxID=2607835 RepID=UPI00144E8CC4|nr:hypothetical protein [Moorena sp. SIO4A1]NEQ62031.1 hypothetical protein [Moorena sp. SIO4A1]
MNIRRVGILPAPKYIETGKMPVLHKMPVLPRCQFYTRCQFYQDASSTGATQGRVPRPRRRAPNHS